MMQALFAGYGDADITPPVGTEMTGYGYYLDRRVTSVLDPLKVRAIALAAGETRLLLISCDLLGLTVAYADAVRQAIGTAHGIPPQHILLACTHTHCGPASQPLPGVGEVDAVYMEGLRGKIAAAAAAALRDLQAAEMSFALERIEPIGYNRRLGGFEPIDPVLKIIQLERPHDRIHLVSYACHAVVAGVQAVATADWPGGLVARLEAHGQRGVVFQGFCGDINPVHRSADASDVEADVAYYGESLYRALIRAERRACVAASITFRAVEMRIDLPFAIPDEAQIAERYRRFMARAPQGKPAFQRFADEWAAATRRRLAEFQEKPYLTDVPIQAMAIGEVQVLGLPGEAFCGYDHRLRKQYANLFSFGYANGNEGYFPTREVYELLDDYAAYTAPMFFQQLGFTPDVETLLLQAGARVLAEVNNDC